MSDILLVLLSSDGQIQKYPYLVSELKADHPNVSFTDPLQASDIAQFGVYFVTSSAQPTFDPMTQAVVEVSPVFDTTLQSWTQTWQVVALTADQQTAVQNAAAAALSAARTKYMLMIDSQVDSIYGAVLGNRAEEYALAETQANAYVAAGYTGTVPSSVQAWASAKGWTAQQAADDIAKTAGQWRYVQAQIRTNRLLRKEQLRTAASPDAINNIMSFWISFITDVKNQLGA